MVLPHKRRHSEDTGWDHLRFDLSIYFVSLLDNSTNQSDCTIAVKVACRMPFDTVTKLNFFFVGVDILHQESFVKLCKVTHSWRVIILQYKTGVILAASKQHTFRIFQWFTSVCQILTGVRSSRKSQELLPHCTMMPCYGEKIILR